MGYWRVEHKKEWEQFTKNIRDRLKFIKEEKGINRDILADYLHPLLKKDEGELRFETSCGARRFIDEITKGNSYGSPSYEAHKKTENVKHLAHFLYSMGYDENSQTVNLFMTIDERLKDYFPPEKGISLQQILKMFADHQFPAVDDSLKDKLVEPNF